jgi:hypothetical protein
MITSTSITPLKSLHIADLKVLARYHGPCVTIQLPSYHPGAGGGTRLAHLRQLTQAAADGLRKLNWPEKADLVVAAIEELLHTLPLESGGPGLTLFCAPRFEAAYETPGIDTEEVTVGSRFHLLPQLIAAQAPQDFFILGISQKRLRLFRYHQGRCDEMALPASVPASLAAAGSFDKPDHTQESRSAGGPSVGSMRGVRFGTSSDHDSEGEYLRHFFEQVDKGLKETLDGAPLFLAGVQEELALYRKTAKHAQILGAEYHGNVEHSSLDTLAEVAGAAAIREYRQASKRAIESLPEIAQKITGDPEAVLEAAQAGRVRQVFVAEGARMARANVAGIYFGEDMINAAVVEGLRTGATIFSVPGSEMGAVGPIAAVLRF